jgi:hypothetical protein
MVRHRQSGATNRAHHGSGGDWTVCRYGACGFCPSAKSPVAEVSGEVASAALLAAHRALIAAASCSRRSGERLSFLFFFFGTPAFSALAGLDFAVERRFFLRAAAAWAIDFLFAFAAFACTTASSFRFSLASFFGPSSSRVSRRRIFFLRVLAFIRESTWTKGGQISSLTTNARKCHVIVSRPAVSN